jgi:hypothetical protein
LKTLSGEKPVSNFAFKTPAIRRRYTLVDAGGYGVIRDGTPANFVFVARCWLALFTSRPLCKYGPRNQPDTRRE